MGIKTYNPYTPSRRNMTGSDFSEITKKTPEKSLLVSMQKKSGRNNQGKITVRHRGGGSRRKYRIIDFKRNKKDGIPATVIGIEYDPNRTANIALICYADGEKKYIIAPQGLTDGMKVMEGPEAEIRVGNCLPLENIPVGTQVHNIELTAFARGELDIVYLGTQYRAHPWQRRSACPFCRQQRTADGKRREICYLKASLRRDENGSHWLPCNYRRGGQCRP